MILRRVIEHVQNQDWTAIVIDLVIVVVGVYVGIQAQTWDTERENRAIERQYLSSLHDELWNQIEENEDRVAMYQDRLAALREVTENFDVVGDVTRLGPGHCRAIARSHTYVGRIGVTTIPPTIGELLSTGRLQLIRNKELRLAIVSYSQSVEGIRQLSSDLQLDRIVLSRRYPGLITLDLREQNNPSCDFDAMRQSSAFRNDMADNGYRFGSYVNDVVAGQQALRIDLHELLDQELQKSHANNTS